MEISDDEIFESLIGTQEMYLFEPLEPRLKLDFESENLNIPLVYARHDSHDNRN